MNAHVDVADLRGAPRSKAARIIGPLIALASLLLASGVIGANLSLWLSGSKFAEGFLAGCGQPCVIRENHGGRVSWYRELAETVNARKTAVYIDGGCASACALFADLARKNIILFRSAEFRFHSTNLGEPPGDQPDVVAWVEEHGGYPSFASGRTLPMDYWTARRFFRTFDENDRIPFIGSQGVIRIVGANAPFWLEANLSGLPGSAPYLLRGLLP